MTFIGPFAATAEYPTPKNPNAITVRRPLTDTRIASFILIVCSFVEQASARSVSGIGLPGWLFQRGPDPGGRVRNIGVENIKGAWEVTYDGLDLPVAVIPTYIHPRMSAQRSVFTIHGAKKEPISHIVPRGV